MTESTVKLSTERYLSLCGQIEKTVADIYEHWSCAPGFNQEMKDLWKVMKNEEMDHFAQIEMLKRLTRNADIGERTLTDEQVSSLADYAHKCLLQVRMKSMTPRAALSVAIKLEKTFMEFHARQAYICKDKGLGSMFSNLSRNDKEHAERLVKTYARLFPGDTPQ